MCGIFGFAIGAANISQRQVFELADQLFLLSETRGREAAGVAIRTPRRLVVHKDGVAASAMLRTQQYRQALQHSVTDALGNGRLERPLAFIGHSRLVTNGMQGIDANNQPIVKGNTVIVHNGIIVNCDAIWRKYPQLERTADVDTEALAALIEEYRKTGSVIQALRNAYDEIKGETSIACLFADLGALALATNTGSIYVSHLPASKTVAFGSEFYIMSRYLAQNGVPSSESKSLIRQLRPGNGLVVDLMTLEEHEFKLSEEDSTAAPMLSPLMGAQRAIEEKNHRDAMYRAGMRRCKKCILPETMPFISFDDEGVCNYCNHYRPMEPLGEGALENRLAAHRKGNGEADCIVALSGGRDSCYGLHLIQRKFGMTPIAYTYDWGMVTDLARRNQARMCGELGVEHLWTSANIKKKRDYIRRNVEAWVKRPDLGMIPLFMAGDKQFFWYANQTMRHTNIDLMIFCQNKLEKTDFKSGFCGIRPPHNDQYAFNLGVAEKVRLATYYGKQYIANPSYLNRSLIDTLTAYVSYYLVPRSYVFLFDYIRWNEEEITSTLLSEYDWEKATDTSTTWRIGDGTAPFYNYIYLSAAGFTEFDTFRSNQIREGMITRERALDLVTEENVPRWPSIREYMQMTRLDFDDVLRAVNSMPRLYWPRQ